jgi:hypothetical protein
MFFQSNNTISVLSELARDRDADDAPDPDDADVVDA